MWVRRVARAAIAAAVAGCFAGTGAGAGASATFVGTTAPASATFSTSTLAAPNGLGATRGGCVLLTSASVTLSWTPTSSGFADGYEVRRSTTSGSGYTSIGTVAGRTTTTFTDGTVAFLTTYFYVVRAKKLAWRSPDSNQAQMTTPTPLCV